MIDFGVCLIGFAIGLFIGAVASLQNNKTKVLSAHAMVYATSIISENESYSVIQKIVPKPKLHTIKNYFILSQPQLLT